MSGLDDVREHMQVIDAEGTPLGKVDKIEGDRIKLTRDSSGSRFTARLNAAWSFVTCSA